MEANAPGFGVGGGSGGGSAATAGMGAAGGGAGGGGGGGRGGGGGGWGGGGGGGVGGRWGFGGIEGEGGGYLDVGDAGSFGGQWRGLSQAFGDGDGKRIGSGGLGGGYLGGVGAAAQGGLGERDGARFVRRAAAGNGFAVDHFADRPVLEEDVLARLELVAGLAKGVDDVERRGVLTAVIDAGVAVVGDADLQVEWSLGQWGEAEIGGEERVSRGGFGADFKRAAIEREQQGLCGSLRKMKRRGLADAHGAAAGQFDFRGVSVGCDGGIAGQRGAGVRDVEDPGGGVGDRGVGSRNRADGLRVQACGGNQDRGDEKETGHDRRVAEADPAG